MTIEVPPTLERNLCLLAAETQTTASTLAQNALKDFVAMQLERKEILRQGDEDIAAGRTIEHEVLFSAIFGKLGQP